ncbi:MAG: O-antigen ligase family protein, partial [Desulfobacterales bacterium]|nr:O-antigen ligase family protein [Desulfobacterales bacterium]
RWEMEMDKIVDSPLTGLGFGGYWGEEHFLRTDGVSPHNLYVQILVKLGLVGLVLYLAVVARVFQKMYQAVTLTGKNKDPEFIFLITGIIALIGSHTYYLAYSFDSFSFFFIGLSMAAVNAGTTGT